MSSPMVEVSTTCIEQLLHAAKLLEQRAMAVQLGNGHLDHRQEMVTNSEDNNQLLKSLYKLGEDYQQRVVASKLRAICTMDTYANSAGSSRRSSPTSMISSCSSSAPGSPISRPTILVSNTLCSTMPPTISINNTMSGSYVTPSSMSVGGPIAHQFQLPSLIPAARSPGVVKGDDAGKSADNSLMSVIAGCGARSGRSSISSNGTSCSPPHSTRQSRAAHNELEKNRRANLRGYLDSLKSILPSECDTSRDTTLSLLTRARNYIQELKERKEAMLYQRSRLIEENARLQEVVESATHTRVPVVAVEQDSDLNTISHQPLPGFGSAPSAFSPVSRAMQGGCAESHAFQAENSQATGSESANVVERLMKMSLEELLMEGLLPAPSMLPLLYPYTCSAIMSPSVQ